MEMEFANGSKITSIHSENVTRGNGSKEFTFLSKTESPSIIRLMEIGYDVKIECKGVNRTFSMTFEGFAFNPYSDDKISSIGYHAVGNTIEEMAQKILNQIEME